MTRPRFAIGLGLADGSGAAFRQRMVDAGFALAHDMPGSIVAVAPGTRTAALGTEGLVIGSLYAPGVPKALESLSPSARAAVLRSAGQHLIHAYWGDYVAFLRRGDDAVLVRAPFGTLPCLLATLDDGKVAASDIDALRASGVPRFSIDHDAVIRQLVAGDLRQDSTCLCGVEELRGGDRLVVQQGTIAPESLWSPWTFASPDRRIDDAAEAERRLRDQALACVAHRTVDIAKPLLLLSGGLDSSIVAAALAAAGREFTCLNFMASNPTADERAYARAVAQSFGRALIECDMATGRADIARLAAVRLPRPVARSFEQHVYGIALDRAAKLGCDGLVDGGGGDNVFCSLQSASPAADCLIDPAGRSHFWRLCGEIGALAETARWKVAWRAYRRAREPARPFGWPVDLRYLDRAARDLAAAAAYHPWLADAHATGLPGRSAHIAMLVAVQGYVEDGPHGAKQISVSPLVSQPLIEHCLRIPSWDWFAQRRNRAAARRAFEPLLPDSIAWRRGKGSPDSFVAELFETNRAWLRSHLGDGWLAEAGVIDTDAVVAAIDDPRPPHGTSFGRIMKLADAESWARGVLGC